MRICTIIARNYLGQAEVLAESFREHHPEGAVSMLVVDDRERSVQSRPGLYDVVRPEDLPIPRFEGMAAMYDITEMCTAVKPWLLRHLLDAGEPVAYFDPDICFYAGVDELFGLARENQIVLTPHLRSPLPDDGHAPDTAYVLAAGAYNLGFIALGPGEASSGLLDWWSARLRFDCINDVANDYFVDQRWFDLVPGMFPNTALVCDPGMNLAYWNLHEHELRADGDGRRLVGDVPLKFFHFSGFDPFAPDELSRYQTRFRFRDVPVVADLCTEYAQRVVARASQPGGTEWPFHKLADGRPLDLFCAGSIEKASVKGRLSSHRSRSTAPTSSSPGSPTSRRMHPARKSIDSGRTSTGTGPTCNLPSLHWLERTASAIWTGSSKQAPPRSSHAACFLGGPIAVPKPLRDPGRRLRTFRKSIHHPRTASPSGA